MKKIAVFCGSSLGFKEAYKNDAIKLGIYFAKNNIDLVYGGGRIGMMGVLADTILEKDGKVIGVIPKFMEHLEVAHTEIDKMIVTKTMSKRKLKISKLVDGYIALPGGFGTLDEIFEALTLVQLGVENKPVGLLNTNGFFDPLMQQLGLMVREGYLTSSNKNMLLVSDSVDDLIVQMLNFDAPQQTKVVDKLVR
jgi:uncharacterized protein (TIGR00730 family)